MLIEIQQECAQWCVLTYTLNGCTVACWLFYTSHTENTKPTKVYRLQIHNDRSKIQRW